MSVLIDTSVWIDFLKGQSNREVLLLEELVEEGEVLITGVVIAEILFGARDTKQWKKYREKFSALPFAELPDTWHLNVSEMGFKLRKAGFQPFLGDIMIALTALTHQVPLLSRDKDFRAYQKVFGLELI